MADDRWNDRNRDSLWGDDRRRDSDRWTREYERRDYGQGAYFQGRAEDERGRDRDRDDARYRPFGETGPISTRSGSYGEDGRPWGASGRYEDLSPSYRDFEANQRRLHRGDYDPDRYTPNPRESRGAEPRSWWDKTQDEMASWFGDENARRRREWDDRTAESEHRREAAYRGETGGEHRGRGPKGYRRSDERVAEDINDRLTDDPYLDASDIEVKVQDGEATLSGTVSRREDKRRAEDLAERVSGVFNVQNNLRVRRDETRYGAPGGDLIA